MVIDKMEIFSLKKNVWRWENEYIKRIVFKIIFSCYSG